MPISCHVQEIVKCFSTRSVTASCHTDFYFSDINTTQVPHSNNFCLVTSIFFHLYTFRETTKIRTLFDLNLNCGISRRIKITDTTESVRHDTVCDCHLSVCAARHEHNRTFHTQAQKQYNSLTCLTIQSFNIPTHASFSHSKHSHTAPANQSRSSFVLHIHQASLTPLPHVYQGIARNLFWGGINFWGGIL